MSTNPQTRKPSMRWLIAVGILAMIAAGATKHPITADTTQASDDDVHIGDVGYLRMPDNVTSVYVFKSQGAVAKFSKLVDAHADYFLIHQQIACDVPTGTKVMNITGEISSAFLSGADGTRDVMVISGPHTGCKGVVPEKILKNK